MSSITAQIAPPLEVLGDWVISCQISLNLPFQTLQAFSKFELPSYPTFELPPVSVIAPKGMSQGTSFPHTSHPSAFFSGK